MFKVASWFLIMGLTGCSTLPENWTFNLEASKEDLIKSEQIKKPFEAVTAIKAPIIDVGISKARVLEILGPNTQTNNGGSSPENYVKNGEIYDVLYFREDTVEHNAVRAYLFKNEILIGIGLANLE